MNLSSAQLAIFAAFVWDAEKEVDSKGNVKVSKLKPADGGGLFEVAGINERYDHAVCFQLKALVEAGKYAEAKTLALPYYVHDTNDALQWTGHAAIEAYLRDCVFNRGEGGATMIAQLALNTKFNLGLKVDGGFGPMTRTGLASMVQVKGAKLVLGALRTGREQYERIHAPPVGARKQFWDGLVNRWNNSLVMANQFLTAQDF
jgi:hypothetical protein